VDDGERERLHRLAVWLAVRRETDEVMAGLTRYGPAASEQVATHLAALRGLLDQEAQAFSALESVAALLPQRALPREAPEPGTLHSLDDARDKREQA